MIVVGQADGLVFNSLGYGYMALVMEERVVGLPSETHTVCTGVSSGCKELGRPVPRPSGGMCRWAQAVVTAAGWMGLISVPGGVLMPIYGGLRWAIFSSLDSILVYWKG